MPHSTGFKRKNNIEFVSIHLRRVFHSLEVFSLLSYCNNVFVSKFEKVRSNLCQFSSFDTLDSENEYIFLSLTKFSTSSVSNSRNLNSSEV